MDIILMCAPDYFSIEYQINPWMDVKRPSESKLAQQQWRFLYDTLTATGAQVRLIQQNPKQPDMVFTANAGLLIAKNTIFLSHFKHPERQGEAPLFKNWFLQNGYRVIETNDQEYFEGAGDGLFCGKTLFAGYGHRSDKSSYEILQQYISNAVVYCELVDDRFYHIDTCFCPITDDSAIWWPQAFSKESRQRMQQHKNLISVNEQEAMNFACNAIVINKTIIMPYCEQQTKNTLEEMGFTIKICPMSEFMKAGGACKCLTLLIAQ